MLVNNTHDPGYYNRPNHFSIYLNSFIYSVVSFIKYHRPIAETFPVNINFYYLVSRVIVAVLGTISIYIAYLVGKEYKEEVGLTAAFLFAFFPSYIIHSHYITPDIPLTLFVLLVMLFAVKYLKKPTTINLITCCMFSALATIEKYPGAITTFLLLLIIITVHHKDKKAVVAIMLKAGLSYLIFMFILSPYLFINYLKVIQAIKLEQRSGHLGADGLGYLGNMLFYAASYLSYSGIILAVFLVIGIICLIKKEGKYAIPLFFGFFYLAALSRLPLHWERWALPMYTSGLLIAAYGICLSWDKAKNAIKYKNIYVPALCLLLFICFSNLVLTGVLESTRLTLKDTRNAAFEYVQNSDINDKNSLYEGYTPFMPGQPATIFRDLHNLDKSIEYIIVSEQMYGRYLKEKERYKKENLFYENVSNFPLITEFKPANELFQPQPLEAVNIVNSVNYYIAYLRNKKALINGPVIKIYKAPDYLKT
jgi:hypothetical protein